MGFASPVSGQRLPGVAEAGLVSPGKERTRVTLCGPAHWPGLGLHTCETGSDNNSLWVEMGCCGVKAGPTHTSPLKSITLGLEHEAELSGEQLSTVMSSQGLGGTLLERPSPVFLSPSQTKKPKTHEGAH